MNEKKSIEAFLIEQREEEEIKTRLQQKENRMKTLKNRNHEKERKKRTKRLIERGAILESVFPKLKILTNQEIQTFLQNLAKEEGTKKHLKTLHNEQDA